MNWDDVDDIIYDGTEEQINAVRCPECGGNLKFSYFPVVKTIVIRCLDCGTTSRAHGANEPPNFALIGLSKA